MSAMFRTALACAVLVLMMIATRAHAGTVALWTFEESHPQSQGAYGPEVGDGFGSSSIHAGRTFINDQAPLGNFIGNGSMWSYGTHGWQEGDYFQFRVSTVNLHDIRLNWDQTRSFNGPADFALQYSTDGQDFHDFALYSVLTNLSENGRLFWDVVHPRQSVYTFDFDLSSLDAIDNQPDVTFRLRAQQAGATVNGSGRVDNFLITGRLTVIPLPPAVLAGLPTFALIAWLIGRR